MPQESHALGSPHAQPVTEQIVLDLAGERLVACTRKDCVIGINFLSVKCSLYLERAFWIVEEVVQTVGTCVSPSGSILNDVLREVYLEHPEQVEKLIATLVGNAAVDHPSHILTPGPEKLLYARLARRRQVAHRPTTG